MKKNYFKPEMEITIFSTEDIITASGETDTGSTGMNIVTDTIGGAEVIDASEGNWVE